MSGRLRAWVLIGYLSSFLGAVLPVVLLFSQRRHMLSDAPLAINLAADGPGWVWLALHSMAFLGILLGLGRALRQGQVTKTSLRILLGVALALVAISLIPGSTLGSILLLPALVTFVSLLILSR